MHAQQPGFELAAAFLKASERFQQLDTDSSARHRLGSASPQKFSVTIGREVGANGTTIALETGRLLGWRVYDHELVEQIARELHVGVRQVEAADERTRNWLEESIQVFGSPRAVTETSYFIHLRQAIESLGEQGSCVIVGRGSFFLLPVATTLRIRIQAPLASRIETVSRERGCSKKEAARYIELETERRHRFIRDHFHREPEDARNYDLVLDSSRISVAGCAEMIVQALAKFPLQERADESRRVVKSAFAC